MGVHGRQTPEGPERLILKRVFSKFAGLVAHGVSNNEPHHNG